MKTIVQLAVLLLFQTVLLAQAKTITGTVSEGNGPLPGAIVYIKGGKGSTTTDFDGKYAITASKTDVLVYSYVGFSTQEVVVGDQTIINIALASDNQLDEVVVLAQGISRESKALGYSVSEVRSKKVARRLAGKASGVQISSASGTAGNASNIVIRGISALSNGNRKNHKALNQLENSIVPETNNKNAGNKSIKETAYIVDGVLIHPSLNDLIEGMDTENIDHKVSYNPVRAKKLFGNLDGKRCVVINTVRGNYRVENDESYKALFENEFKSVSYDPLSTFSIDVDRASYSNVRRMINNGQDIPLDAVKIEEMVNYFDYDYATPQDEKLFAVHTEVAQTPWNKESLLMKIGLKGKEINTDELPASNLTFLIDISGSMSYANKLPLLKSAFQVLVKKLREQDKVSIVVYAGAAGVVLEPTSGNEKEKIMNAINNLNAGGSTAGGQGIELAYKLAQQNFKKKGNNRIILATDGDFNVGMNSDKAMETLIEEKRESGVFLTCIGFGMGNYKDSKLETLADKGNGNYAYIDTMQEAHKFLGKEFSGTLHTIAKDVKIQVEFNPAVVKSYRLIGYENRLLNNEDFKDDTKDAGEIGAGHTVTALYEVVPVQSVYSPVDGDALKYQNVAPGLVDELLTVKLRYKEPAGNKSKLMEHVVKNTTNDTLTEDFRFMSAVAMFGMKLRDSKFVKDIKQEDLVTLANSGRGKDEDGFRAEFIRLVKAK